MHIRGKICDAEETQIFIARKCGSRLNYFKIL